MYKGKYAEVRINNYVAYLLNQPFSYFNWKSVAI